MDELGKAFAIAKRNPIIIIAAAAGLGWALGSGLFSLPGLSLAAAPATTPPPAAGAKPPIPASGGPTQVSASLPVMTAPTDLWSGFSA